MVVKRIAGVISLGIISLMVGCGGGSGSSNVDVTVKERILIGQLMGASAIKGVTYTSSACASNCVTNAKGEFQYYLGQDVEFKAGTVALGKLKGAASIMPNDLSGETSLTGEKALRIEQLLQALDSDTNPTNGLDIATKAQQLTAACGLNDNANLMACNLPLVDTAQATSDLMAGVKALAGDFQFKALHINDHHSHLEPSITNLNLGGNLAQINTGGFSSVVAGYKTLFSTSTPTLKLHAGDAITGTVLYSLRRGESDAALMDQVCFDALTMGNHEFDGGDAGLVKFLNFLKAGTCKTPALSANVQPELGVSPLAKSTATDYLKPYTIKELGGKKVGIIGITVADKTKASSSPDPTTLFLPEAETSQKYINELKAQGVDKIVLLTHHGYERDLALAAKLDGVDLIVGGDSHSLLGKNYKTWGLTPEGDYPSFVHDSKGRKVCVTQSWQYAQIIGEVNVAFNSEGDVLSCHGVPHLLVNSLISVNGKAANFSAEQLKTATSTDTAIQNVITALNQQAEFALTTPDATAELALKPYLDEKKNFATKIVGSAPENLCFERIPGQGRSTLAGCNAKTWQQGSDISNIVAKGFLEMSKSSEVCIQNGGGVRIDVPAGTISVETAYTLLPFANTLTEIQMTGQQIRDVLEEAMDAALAGSSGSYPYAAGLRWQVNLAQVKGSRLSNLQVNPRVKGTWVDIDPAKTYKVVTNSFTAGGQDGYLTFGKIPAAQKVDTFLDYAQSFVDYVQTLTNSGSQVTKLPIEEYSTQSCLTDAAGKYCMPPKQ